MTGSSRAPEATSPHVGGGSRVSDLVTPENVPHLSPFGGTPGNELSPSGGAPLTLGLETDLTTISGGLIYRF